MLQQTVTLLRKHGIKLSKRAGQHQVVEPIILQRMVDYAELSQRDVVLEIGAGVGNLTYLLAGKAGRVIAIERDRRLMKILSERLRGCSNVDLLCGDALRIELPEFNKVVSNLPYGISSEITFRLLEHDFEIAVLMYQREFAERLMAKPGSEGYSRLTVNVYRRANVELLEEVPPTVFVPQPKVSSSIVRLRPKSPPFEVVNENLFSKTVRVLFQHRRKKVRNALYHSFGEIFPDETMSKAEKRDLIRQLFPEELTEIHVMELPPEKFGEIANRLANMIEERDSPIP